MAGTRIPMLVRLATRYARRHRVQTVRAILGLVVVSLVLTTGLGLGDSLDASLERSIDDRFGPIEVVARGPQQFNDTLARDVAALPAAQALGIKGTSSLVVVGSVANPTRHRAEAFATLRGMASAELDALGPLPGGAAEPRPGEVVLSQLLADRLDARIGDRLEMRAFPPGLNETAGVETVSSNGTLSQTPTEVPFPVAGDALGILATVRLNGNGTLGSASLRSPGGQEFPGEPTDDGFEMRVLGPVEAGSWNLTLTGPSGTRYEARVFTAATPPDLESLLVVFNATVSGISPTQGRAAIGTRPAALLPLADLQAALNLTGKASQAYFSTTGDPQAAAAAVQAQLGNTTWRVDAAKSDAIARVHEQAGTITGFILVMGGFTMVASILLAYVLFSSLVEERRVELGIARAVGLTRREVATTMVLEALVYAALAAVVGVALGVALVYGLVILINHYAAQFNAPTFFLALKPLTVPLAFAGGVLLPVLTIALGSARFARLDPARAIRGAPEDVRVHRGTATAAGLLLVLAGLALSLGTLWRLVGVGIAAAGVTALLLSARRRAWAALAAAAGIAYTVWSLYDFDAFPPGQREMDPVLTMARALVVALLVSALAMCSPRPFRAAGRAFAWVGGLRRASYVSLRYLGARRVQAGLTAAMVAVVAVIVTVMGTLAAIFASTIVTSEGGYDIVGQTAFPLTTFPHPLSLEDQAAVARADILPTHRPLGNAGSGLRVDGQPWREGRFARFAGVTPGFAAGNGYTLQDRDARYATDRDAWQAVADGTAVLAPPWYFQPDGLHTGATLQVGQGRGAHNYTVAGMVTDARRGDLFVAYDDVRAMGFPQMAVVLVRTAPGADAPALAHRLTDAYQGEGLVFESVAEEAQQTADILQASLLVLQSFLFLGVFVGIASTGFLAARAVHERMRDIGTLRALGYEPKDVARAFVLESVLVSAVGLLIGVVVGGIVAHSIWWRTIRSFSGHFALPWGVLAAFATAVLVLTALASWSPTRRAARLDPAVALRYVE